MNETRKFGLAQTIAVLLAIAFVAGVLLAIRGAQAQTLSSCEHAPDNQALVECVKLNLGTDTLHNVQKVISVLGKPLAKGIAVACPKDEVGTVLQDQCQGFPSLIHKIGNALVTTVFGEHQGEHVLIHLTVGELSPQDEETINERIREKQPVLPGYQPV